MSRFAAARRRLSTLLIQQLRQGITPDSLALTLAMGSILGVFPLLGSTTALCAAAGFWLRLNQPAIHTVNYIVYPFQLLLLLPFYRAGEALFGQPPVPIFSIGDLIARFQAGPWQFVIDYGMVAVYGIVVWLLVAPPAAAAIYFGSRPLLAALARRSSPAPGSPLP